MEIIDGKKVSEKIINELEEKIKQSKLSVNIKILQVGQDNASSIYVKRKKQIANKIGINAIHEQINENISEQELINIINDLNKDEKVDGYIVQLPLPKHINENKIISQIDPQKDIDGFTAQNAGLVMQNNYNLVPCTPKGIMELVKYYNIKLEGKTVVIVGRSNIVGKPLGMLMLNENATVTYAHSKTQNLNQITKQADIIVAAAGVKKLIKANMVKDEVIIFDVGINRDSQNNICGDVDFEQVKNKASLITPVPGGVGPMTVAMLMQNAFEIKLKSKKK